MIFGDKKNSKRTAQLKSVLEDAVDEALKREARELAHAQSLKAYKELLDAGALTQEEFDRKKAELLGL